MLEQRDFTIIADIVNRAMIPVISHIEDTRRDIAHMQQGISDIQQDIKQLQDEVAKIAPMQQAIEQLQVEVAKIDPMQQAISTTKQDIVKINLELENNVQHKINILTEGYGSLSSKMDMMIEEQKHQGKKQDYLDLQLKSHSSRITHVTQLIEDLPWQHGKDNTL